MRNPHLVKSPMLVVGLSLSNKRIYYKTKWSCLKASGIVLRRKMNWQKWKILLHYCKWSWLWPFQPIKCPPLPITENKLFRPKAFQNKSQKKEGSGMKSFRAIVHRNLYFEKQGSKRKDSLDSTRLWTPKLFSKYQFVFACNLQFLGSERNNKKFWLHLHESVKEHSK